jgi:Ca2+-binding EF-hand superfamily protein
LYDLYDKDKSGLDRNDMRALFCRVQEESDEGDVTITWEDVDDRMKAMDVNEDGKVSKEEFMKYMLGQNE